MATQQKPWATYANIFIQAFVALVLMVGVDAMRSNTKSTQVNSGAIIKLFEKQCAMKDIVDAHHAADKIMDKDDVKIVHHEMMSK